MDKGSAEAAYLFPGWLQGAIVGVAIDTFHRCRLIKYHGAALYNPCQRVAPRTGHLLMRTLQRE